MSMQARWAQQHLHDLLSKSHRHDIRCQGQVLPHYLRFECYAISAVFYFAILATVTPAPPSLSFGSSYEAT
jgi:hypothetical protein